MSTSAGGGDWLVVQELLERGDPAFVDELRKITEADALASFALRWYADRRPTSRRLLLAYLDRPLNAYRHEPLVKRLFKLAEQAGDDQVMGRFLILFDRSVRRVVRRRRQFESESVDGLEQAQSLVQEWQASGLEGVNSWPIWGARFMVRGFWSEEVIAMPGGTTMPRGKMIDSFLDWDPRPPRFKMFKAPDWAFKLKLNPREFRDAHEVPEKHRQQLERFRLFSIATRNYLRRRAWRYFRKLGRQHPERYIAAVCEALILYEDDDVKDSLALIDNWGLVHILFHHSPALLARPRGWIPAEGHSLDELAPAPMFERLWKAAARALLDVMIRCRCRPVRQWAIQLVRRDPQAVMDAVTLEELLGMLAHADGEVVALAAELLRGAQGLATLSPERWLALAETDNPAALEILAELIERYVPPEQVSLAQAVRLALSRPLPLARLGLAWLRTKTPHGDDECRMLLGLVEAEAEAVRPELLHWARGQLSAAPEFRPDWVLEYLDCRHADARAEGWAWLNDEPRARDDVSLWQRLLESPYDDVHLALVAMLEKHVTGRDLDQAARLALDPGLLRLLWASVLLNIHRGGRAKPVVIGQLLRRLEARPEEATELLPLLGVALRSVRGPEWRAGLAAVVQLVERDANTAPLVRAAFPELQLT